MEGPVPASSQVEFREQAHRLYDLSTTGDIAVRLYLTWAALGGFAVVLLLGRYGSTTRQPGGRCGSSSSAAAAPAWWAGVSVGS